MSGFLMHMLQVTRPFLAYYLGEEFFEPQPYFNTTQNKHQLVRNRVWYVASCAACGVAGVLYFCSV